MSQSVEESVFNVYRNLALCFLSESKASHERAQRVAKNLDPEEAAKVKDKAFNQEVERADRVRRKREAEARRKAEEEGIEYTPKPTATERMKKRIRTPKTNGQGSFLRMSQSVKESVFNTYRNLAYCLLENEVELKGPYWNTSKLSPEERADRAGEDTQRNFQNDVRGKKHVKRREKRLARRSELAREAEARAKDKNKK
jgi:hypothetical protein